MSDERNDERGRLHRRHLTRGVNHRANTASMVPGKGTLAEHLPFATPEAAANRALRGALGSVARVDAWVSPLAASLAAADYLESGRLSFEIRSALRRAENDLAALERQDPEQAARLTDQIAGARSQLARRASELAPILGAAPVLEDFNAGSADAERAWRETRTGHPTAATAHDWEREASPIASSLGLGAVTIKTGDEGRAITDREDARGVALDGIVHLHPDRVRADTPAGREVLAHELVHLAQARLPSGTQEDRGAAEHEAAAIAREIASGSPARQPQQRIDLSRPAADRHAETLAPRNRPAPAAADDVIATRAVSFQSLLGIARQRVATLLALLDGDVPTRVDDARRDAIGIKAALDELSASVPAVKEARIAVEAAEAMRFKLDMTHSAAENDLLADVKAARMQAQARIDASYAKDALQGIQLWLHAKDAATALADGTREWSAAGPGEVGPYKLYPHVKKKRLVFYVAYHEQRRQNEWVVGADDAEDFAASVDLYAGAARVALPGSANVPHSQEDGAIDAHLPSMLEQEGMGAVVWNGMDLANGGSSLNGARNAGLRVDLYAKEADRIAKEMLAGVKAGKIDHLEARDKAIEGRNEAMRETRRQQSPAARYMARKVKEDKGRSTDYMVDRKTKGLIEDAAEKPTVREQLLKDSPEWGKYIEAEAQGTADASMYKQASEELGAQPAVSAAIIKSAGRPNPRLTWAIRYLVRPGTTALGALGVLDMVEEIADAKEGERLHVAARELGGFAGGIVGGEAGSISAVFLASAIVSSAGVLLVVSIIGGFIGSVIGATAGSYAHHAVEHTAQAGPLAAKAVMPMTASAAGGGYAGMLDRSQRKMARSGVVNALEDHIFEIDGEVRALEDQIAEAPDRGAMERLQAERLSLLDRRSVYDELLVASRTGQMDEKQLSDFIRENDL